MKKSPSTLTEKPPPKSDSTNWPELSASERENRVRRIFAARASSSPLYAARAAKAPAFWETYSVGGPFMFPEEWLHMDPEEVAGKFPIRDEFSNEAVATGLDQEIIKKSD